MASRYRSFLLAFLAASAFAAAGGCTAADNTGPNVTGAREEPPGTEKLTDPGKVNAGGPGVPAELRK